LYLINSIYNIFFLERWTTGSATHKVSFPKEYSLISNIFAYHFEIGTFLIGFAAFFTALGVMLFFDSGLISVGNVRQISVVI
jgi:hypothetical protein